MSKSTEQPFGTAVRIFASVAFAFLLLAGAALMVRPATAQTALAPRAEVVKLLGDKYAEKPMALGLTETGGVIEVFASRDGATWTLVLTTPHGLSRLIASGEAWTPIKELAGNPD